MKQIFFHQKKKRKIDYRHYDNGIDGEIKDNRRQFAAYLKGHELEGETPKLRYSETGIKVLGARKIVFLMRIETDYLLSFPDYRRKDHFNSNTIKKSLDSITMD